MLRQEINLYRQFTAPLTNATYITWKRYWISNGVYAALMVIVYLYSLMNTTFMRHDAEKLQQQLISYQSDFKKLKDSFPQLFFSENINESVNNLKNQITAQQKIIGILSRHAPFSEVLSALSRTIIPNVWLSYMLIDKSGNIVVLNGDSIGMTNLNDYLVNLKKDAVFAKYELVVQEVKNNDVKNPNNHLDFQINMARNNNE
jgi:Tfp pilus assembly protein PilN